jgi:Spy/CpxP family protein refolding chaperone
VSVSDPVIVPPPPPRGSKKTIVIAVIVVLVAFVSGAIAGMFVEHVHLMRRMHGRTSRFAPQMMVHRLDRTLDLTPEQRTKVEEIVMRHHQRIVAITESARPRVREELEAANREIEALLTPEQREKFAKLRLHLGHREGRSRTESTR